MKLNCLVVDDEPLARKGLVEYVGEIDFLNLVGECENALKASAFMSEHRVDLIFLDIQMPKISGIDFLRNLKHPPLVIFTTAFPQYALEGYALDITDYLVKPISFERFFKASQKAYDLFALRAQAGQQAMKEDYFFVKCDGKFEKLLYDEVQFAEALQNYVMIHTAEKKLITYMTLASLESQLPADQFIKVHKSYIVAISKVKTIEGNEVVIGTNRIPISRNLKDEVVQHILGNKLFKRSK